VLSAKKPETYKKACTSFRLQNFHSVRIKTVPEEVHELDETSPGCVCSIRQYGTSTERPELQAQRNLAHRNARVWLEYKAYEENGR
jgi:hypothetical protein